MKSSARRYIDPWKVIDFLTAAPYAFELIKDNDYFDHAYLTHPQLDYLISIPTYDLLSREEFERIMSRTQISEAAYAHLADR